jgi:exosortase
MVQMTGSFHEYRSRGLPRVDPAGLVLVSVGIAAFVYLFWSTFIWLYIRWTAADTYYSHGFIIAPISAWIFWRQSRVKDHLSQKALEIPPVCGMTLSMLLYVGGGYFRVYFLSGLSMILFTIFAGWLLLGTSSFKRHLFPFLYLFLMLPLPSAILDKLTVPVKIIVTKLSVPILNIAGIPYFLNGFRIQLPGGTLFIDNPCSGMRSLVAFLTLGLMIVYVDGLRGWRAGLVLACVLPIAVISNVLRVQTLLMCANYIGIDSVQPGAVVHDWAGLPMFALGLLLLFLLTRAISKER